MLGPPSEREDLFRIDGNGAAGVLQQIFSVEMTTASCTCPNCGRVSAVGALHLYGGAMGCVLRCPSCEALMWCITSGRAGYFIELRGVVRVRPSEG
jgi:Zn finger protein HypA/HybF involved in hydrogenase expression